MVRWRSPISLILLLAPVVVACSTADDDLGPSGLSHERPVAPVPEASTAVLASDDALGDERAGTEPKASDSSPASSDFSTLYTLDYSILREYERAFASQGPRIRYPVCVTAEFSITDAQRRRYRALEEQAINRWNDALAGAPGWRVENISLYLVGGSSPGSCPRTDNGLRVYELRGLANTDRGYAEFYNYVNAIGRREFAAENLRREMHEYGHQLGLGDTYTESSYQTPIGQPPGIMNLYYEVDGLTRDDIDAVRHIWWMIRNNSNDPCPTGYRTGEAPTNRNDHRFCVRTNGGDPDPDPDTGDPSCRNTNRHCAAWADRGECSANPGYMLTNCCASCERANDQPDPSCRDTNQYCADWASRGECSRNPGYMLTNCCASCERANGQPDPSCADSNNNCGAWADRGECSANPGYMLTNCCASCERVNVEPNPSCRDTSQYCADWANRGECSRNPGYMLSNCCESCARE